MSVICPVICPVIIINYKNYENSFGAKGMDLTKKIETVAQETGAPIIVVPPTTDILRISQYSTLPVFAQHIDPIGFGSNTGYTLPAAVKEAGAIGTLINHSERRLEFTKIGECVSITKQIGLTSVVCTKDIAASGEAATLGPDFVAVEPPELIGGDISVSKARPEVVEGSVQAVKSVNGQVRVLCGAGVKNGEDVRKAIELGSEGVLLASGVVKAQNVEEVMRDLISGLD